MLNMFPVWRNGSKVNGRLEPYKAEHAFDREIDVYIQASQLKQKQTQRQIC
jgi:hypothetical protein